MDLSSIRSALNGFSDASPVLPASKATSAQAGAFLLGAESRLGAVMDLNSPAQLQPEIIDDFTQDDMLAIDYAPGEPVPVMSLFYNADFAATEVRLEGITVALVRMREGHGPLRAAAISLTADASLRP